MRTTAAPAGLLQQNSFCLACTYLFVGGDERGGKEEGQGGRGRGDVGTGEASLWGGSLKG